MASLWLFFLALAVVFLLPGPDMILLLQTGARQGRGAALATAIGLGIARGCHVALAALGLAALFKAAPWTFEVVRLAGAAYLLWIGIQCLRSTLVPNLNGGDVAQTQGQWREAVRRGLLTNLLNPKALLFFVGLLAAMVTPQVGSLTRGLLILELFLLSLAWFGLLAWCLSTPRAQRLLGRVQRPLNLATGLLFGAVSLSILGGMAEQLI